MNTAAPAQPTARADGSRPDPPGTPPQHDPQTDPVLSDPEAERRMLLLTELQAALTQRGVRAVVARHHRLVLSSAGQTFTPYGLTDPSLHIFTPSGTRKATVCAAAYRIDNGDEHPASDPAAAAAAICSQHAPATA
jgi:hypothetical protein